MAKDKKKRIITYVPGGTYQPPKVRNYYEEIVEQERLSSPPIKPADTFYPINSVLKQGTQPKPTTPGKTSSTFEPKPPSSVLFGPDSLLPKDNVIRGDVLSFVPNISPKEAVRAWEVLSGSLDPYFRAELEKDEVKKRVRLAQLQQEAIKLQKEGKYAIPKYKIDFENPDKLTIEQIEDGILSGQIMVEPTDYYPLKYYEKDEKGQLRKETIYIPVSFNVYKLLPREIGGKKYKVKAELPFAYIDKEMKIKKMGRSVISEAVQDLFGNALDKPMETMVKAFSLPSLPVGPVPNIYGIRSLLHGPQGAASIPEPTRGYLTSNPVLALLGIPQILPYSSTYLEEPGGKPLPEGNYPLYTGTTPTQMEKLENPYLGFGEGLAGGISPLVQLPTIIQGKQPQLPTYLPTVGIEPEKAVLEKYKQAIERSEWQGIISGVLSLVALGELKLASVPIGGLLVGTSFLVEPWVTKTDRNTLSKLFESVINAGMMLAMGRVGTAAKALKTGRPIWPAYSKDVLKRTGVFLGTEAVKKEFLEPPLTEEQKRERVKEYIYGLTFALFLELFGLRHGFKLAQAAKKLQRGKELGQKLAKLEDIINKADKPNVRFTPEEKQVMEEFGITLEDASLLKKTNDLILQSSKPEKIELSPQAQEALGFIGKTGEEFVKDIADFLKPMSEKIQESKKNIVKPIEDAEFYKKLPQTIQEYFQRAKETEKEVVPKEEETPPIALSTGATLGETAQKAGEIIQKEVPKVEFEGPKEKETTVALPGLTAAEEFSRIVDALQAEFKQIVKLDKEGKIDLNEPDNYRKIDEWINTVKEREYEIGGQKFKFTTDEAVLNVIRNIEDIPNASKISRGYLQKAKEGLENRLEKVKKEEEKGEIRQKAKDAYYSFLKEIDENLVGLLSESENKELQHLKKFIDENLIHNQEDLDLYVKRWQRLISKLKSEFQDRYLNISERTPKIKRQIEDAINFIEKFQSTTPGIEKLLPEEIEGLNKLKQNLQQRKDNIDKYNFYVKPYQSIYAKTQRLLEQLPIKLNNLSEKIKSRIEKERLEEAKLKPEYELSFRERQSLIDLTFPEFKDAIKSLKEAREIIKKIKIPSLREREIIQKVNEFYQLAKDVFWARKKEGGPLYTYDKTLSDAKKIIDFVEKNPGLLNEINKIMAEQIARKLSPKKLETPNEEQIQEIKRRLSLAQNTYEAIHSEAKKYGLELDPRTERAIKERSKYISETLEGISYEGNPRYVTSLLNKLNRELNIFEQSVARAKNYIDNKIKATKEKFLDPTYRPNFQERQKLIEEKYPFYPNYSKKVKDIFEQYQRLKKKKFLYVRNLDLERLMQTISDFEVEKRNHLTLPQIEALMHKLKRFVEDTHNEGLAEHYAKEYERKSREYEEKIRQKELERQEKERIKEAERLAEEKERREKLESLKTPQEKQKGLEGEEQAKRELETKPQAQEPQKEVSEAVKATEGPGLFDEVDKVQPPTKGEPEAGGKSKPKKPPTEEPPPPTLEPLPPPKPKEPPAKTEKPKTEKPRKSTSEEQPRFEPKIAETGKGEKSGEPKSVTPVEPVKKEEKSQETPSQPILGADSRGVINKAIRNDFKNISLKDLEKTAKDLAENVNKISQQDSKFKGNIDLFVSNVIGFIKKMKSKSEEDEAVKSRIKWYIEIYQKGLYDKALTDKKVLESIVKSLDKADNLSERLEWFLSSLYDYNKNRVAIEKGEIPDFLWEKAFEPYFERIKAGKLKKEILQAIEKAKKNPQTKEFFEVALITPLNTFRKLYYDFLNAHSSTGYNIKTFYSELLGREGADAIWLFANRKNKEKINDNKAHFISDEIRGDAEKLAKFLENKAVELSPGDFNALILELQGTGTSLLGANQILHSKYHARTSDPIGLKLNIMKQRGMKEEAKAAIEKYGDFLSEIQDRERFDPNKPPIYYAIEEVARAANQLDFPLFADQYIEILAKAGELSGYRLQQIQGYIENLYKERKGLKLSEDTMDSLMELYEFLGKEYYYEHQRLIVDELLQRLQNANNKYEVIDRLVDAAERLDKDNYDYFFEFWGGFVNYLKSKGEKFHKETLDTIKKVWGIKDDSFKNAEGLMELADKISSESQLWNNRRSYEASLPLMGKIIEEIEEAALKMDVDDFMVYASDLAFDFNVLGQRRKASIIQDFFKERFPGFDPGNFALFSPYNRQALRNLWELIRKEKQGFMQQITEMITGPIKETEFTKNQKEVQEIKAEGITDQDLANIRSEIDRKIAEKAKKVKGLKLLDYLDRMIEKEISLMVEYYENKGIKKELDDIRDEVWLRHKENYDKAVNDALNDGDFGPDINTFLIGSSLALWGADQLVDDEGELKDALTAALPFLVLGKPLSRGAKRFRIRSFDFLKKLEKTKIKEFREIEDLAIRSKFYNEIISKAPEMKEQAKNTAMALIKWAKSFTMRSVFVQADRNPLAREISLQMVDSERKVKKLYNQIAKDFDNYLQKIDAKDLAIIDRAMILTQSDLYEYKRRQSEIKSKIAEVYGEETAEEVIKFVPLQDIIRRNLAIAHSIYAKDESLKEGRISYLLDKYNELRSLYKKIAQVNYVYDNAMQLNIPLSELGPRIEEAKRKVELGEKAITFLLEKRSDLLNQKNDLKKEIHSYIRNNRKEAFDIVKNMLTDVENPIRKLLADALAGGETQKIELLLDRVIGKGKGILSRNVIERLAKGEGEKGLENILIQEIFKRLYSIDKNIKKVLEKENLHKKLAIEAKGKIRQALQHLKNLESKEGKLINKVGELEKVGLKIRQEVANKIRAIKKQIKPFKQIVDVFGEEGIKRFLEQMEESVHWNPLWERTEGDYGVKIMSATKHPELGYVFKPEEEARLKLVLYETSPGKLEKKIEDVSEKLKLQHVEGNIYSWVNPDNGEKEFVRISRFHRKELDFYKRFYPRLRNLMDELEQYLREQIKLVESERVDQKLLELNTQGLKERFEELKLAFKVGDSNAMKEILEGYDPVITGALTNLSLTELAGNLSNVRDLENAIRILTRARSRLYRTLQFHDFKGYEVSDDPIKQSNLAKLAVSRFIQGSLEKNIKNSIVNYLRNDVGKLIEYYNLHHTPFDQYIKTLISDLNDVPATLYQMGLVKIGKKTFDFTKATKAAASLAYFKVFFGNIKAGINNLFYANFIRLLNRKIERITSDDTKLGFSLGEIIKTATTSLPKALRIWTKYYIANYGKPTQQAPKIYADPLKQATFEEIFNSGYFTSSVTDYVTSFGKLLRLKDKLRLPGSKFHKGLEILMDMSFWLQRQSEMINKIATFESVYNKLVKETGIRSPEKLANYIVLSIFNDVGFYEPFYLGGTARALQSNPLGKISLMMLKPQIFMLQRILGGLEALFNKNQLNNSPREKLDAFIGLGAMASIGILLGGFVGFPLLGDLLKAIREVEDDVIKDKSDFKYDQLYTEFAKWLKELGFSGKQINEIFLIMERGLISYLTGQSFEIYNFISPGSPFIYDLFLRTTKDVYGIATDPLADSQKGKKIFLELLSPIQLQYIREWLEGLYSGHRTLPGKFFDAVGREMTWRDYVFGPIGRGPIERRLRKEAEARRINDLRTLEGRFQYLNKVLEEVLRGRGGLEKAIQYSIKKFRTKDPELNFVVDWALAGFNAYNLYFIEDVHYTNSYYLSLFSNPDNRDILQFIFSKIKGKDFELTEGKPEDIERFYNDIRKRVVQFYEHYAWKKAFNDKIVPDLKAQGYNIGRLLDSQLPTRFEQAALPKIYKYLRRNDYNKIKKLKGMKQVKILGRLYPLVILLERINQQTYSPEDREKIRNFVKNVYDEIIQEFWEEENIK